MKKRLVRTCMKKLSKLSPDSLLNFIHDEMINNEDLRFRVAYKVSIFQSSAIKVLFITSEAEVRQSLEIIICFVFLILLISDWNLNNLFMKVLTWRDKTLNIKLQLLYKDIKFQMKIVWWSIIHNLYYNLAFACIQELWKKIRIKEGIYNILVIKCRFHILLADCGFSEVLFAYDGSLFH